MINNSVIDLIVKNSPHMEWIRKGTVLLVRHGSHAYGTNVESSDEDFKGVCIPPIKYFFGTMHHFEQAELKAPNPDTVVYDIRKFFNLAVANNPSIIEVLFVDPQDHLFVSEIGQKIIDNRDKFLSKRIRFSFAGYAHSQLKRIFLHRNYLLNPPKGYPTRTEMNLPEQSLIPNDQLMAAEADIQKELDKFNFDFLEEVSEPVKIGIRSVMIEMLAVLKITTEDQWLSAARKVGLSDNFIEIMQKERAYKNLKSQWDKYQEWKKNRNPVRAAMEEKFGYDCYAEETEFLTDVGWKTYDQITSSDKLATIYTGKSKFRKFLGVEYENYTERFDGTFNGNLYNLVGYHTDVMITPNHKMLIREESQNTGKIEDWSLTDADHVPHTFNILRQITPNTKNHSDQNIFDFDQTGIADVAFMRLMGWYLSDGTIGFYKTTPDVLVISQIKKDARGRPGKLVHSIKMFINKYAAYAGGSSRLYEYIKPPNYLNKKEHTEMLLHINGILPKIIYKECGNVDNKRIPRWVFSLSKRKMEALLDGLIRGDGTVFRPDNSIIYYSTLKGLADDVQELAFLCGFETSLYGPYYSTHYRSSGEEYQLSMYQVHINKTREQTRKLGRHSFRKIPVENKRIVCFSVPNSILITRYNGQIGMHGNSKHALHLIRLLRVCNEVLSTGKVIVKRPDREELLSIRNGGWTYDQLIQEAEKLDVQAEELYKTSTILPKTPDFEYLDNLCIELVERSLNEK